MSLINTTLTAVPYYLVDGDGNIVSSALPTGVDRSGTIAAANTAQVLAPANAKRQALTIQNVSDTNLTISENGADASASNGYSLTPGSAMNVSTNRSISVFCTAAGKRFAATEI